MYGEGILKELGRLNWLQRERRGVIFIWYNITICIIESTKWIIDSISYKLLTYSYVLLVLLSVLLFLSCI